MATGSSLHSSISTLLNDFYEEAFFTLRQDNLLVPTVRFFGGQQGLQDRKNSTYDDANIRTIGEDDDVTPTQFDRTLLSTLTPSIYADQVYVSDERMKSDDHNVMADAAMNLGAAFAQDVDERIATNFSSLTGGTIGSAGAAITWGKITAARSILHAANARPPFFCALHPYVWDVLYNLSNVAGTSGWIRSPQFQDRAVNNYFESPAMSGVTFIITPSIAIDASDDAIGAMYARDALAYDERTPFNIRTERDESRGGGGTELNASMTYAHGTWRPAVGVQIIADAATPTG